MNVLHHLPQGTEHLFPLADRLRRDVFLRPDRRLFLLLRRRRLFVRQSLQSTMMGQSQPMDVNEWVVRNLLSNISVIGLFMCPMITMRLFAEEKRTGTIELLVTSPLRDCEIILGKWLAAFILYAGDAGDFRARYADPVPYGKSGLETDADRLSRPAAAGRVHAGDRHVYFLLHAQSDRRRRGDVRRLPAAVGDHWASSFD